MLTPTLLILSWPFEFYKFILNHSLCCFHATPMDTSKGRISYRVFTLHGDLQCPKIVFRDLEQPINNQTILSRTSLLTWIRQTLHPCPSWRLFVYSCRSLASCRLMMNCRGYHQCLQPPSCNPQYCISPKDHQCKGEPWFLSQHTLLDAVT